MYLDYHFVEIEVRLSLTFSQIDIHIFYQINNAGNQNHRTTSEFSIIKKKYCLVSLSFILTAP